MASSPPPLPPPPSAGDEIFAGHPEPLPPAPPEASPPAPPPSHLLTADEIHEKAASSKISPADSAPAAPSNKSVLDTINSLLRQQKTKVQSSLPTTGQTAAAARKVLSKKNREKISRAGADFTSSLLTSSRGVGLSALAVVLSMVTEIYPASPHYNLHLSAAAVYLHAVPPPPAPESSRGRPSKQVCMDVGSKPFLKLYFAAMFFSLAADLDYLVSGDQPLRVYQGELLRELSGSTAGVCRAALGLLAAVKVLIVLSVSSRTEAGERLRRRAYKPLRYFLPTLAMPSSFRRAIAKRLFAFAWLNVLGAVCLATLALIALFAFPYELPPPPDVMPPPSPPHPHPP